MTRADYQAYLASREWALKREAVRRRSGNRCERCWTNDMDAVHHKTYERVGDERLDDLMAICDPCHEFLSGKTDVDPLTNGIAIYLAGPFTAPDWRECLMGEPGAIHGSPFVNAGRFAVVPRGLRGDFDAVGPWRLRTHGENDHGILSGHGDGLCQCCGRPEVVEICKRAILDCDAVFAWFPDTASIPAGTLWELGFAVGKDKPIAIARRSTWNAEFAGDYWFPLTAADMTIFAETAAAAWLRFVADWPDLVRSRRQ